MAVENAANALILKLGGTEARDHRAITGLVAVVRRVRPDWLAEEDCARLVERGKNIQREVVYTRYPLKAGDRWVTPMEYYTRQRAEGIIHDAKFVVDAIKKYLQRTTV
jgi:HEPN domain-containing protein